MGKEQNETKRNETKRNEVNGFKSVLIGLKKGFIAFGKPKKPTKNKKNPTGVNLPKQKILRG